MHFYSQTDIHNPLRYLIRLKSSFTYIGTKKAKNSHLKIKFFQKNLRAAETAPKREKKQVILLYRTAEDQTSNADNS